MAPRTLGVDVQLIIVEVLSKSSPRSLLNVALSSKSLYGLSRSFIYRVIRFTFTRSRRDINRRLIDLLLADDYLSAKVREIRILWAPSAKLQPGEGSKIELELLGQALPKFKGLEKFIWDAQYSILSWLLKSLQRHHPHCSLYTHHPASQDSAQTLPRLHGSPCLFSLDVALTRGQVLALSSFQKILITAPKLRDLAIVAPLTGLYILIPDQELAELAELEPLPLRSLELYGPVFDISKLPVIWPMLERLSLDSAYNMTAFPTSAVVPEFTGLKSLKAQTGIDFHGSPFLKAIKKQCKRLEVLDLTGVIEVDLSAMGDFLRNAGKTLTKLKLHDNWSLYGDDGWEFISFEHLRCIAKYCRNLRSLSFDLKCDGREWPYTMLQCIADELWFLVHLELNILIDNPQNDHPTSPKATIDSVPEIWKFLWQQTLNSRICKGHSITQPRLKSLDIIVGSRISNPSPEGSQVDQQRFTIDLSERDDEARGGIAKVRCTELEALLSKVSSSGALWNHQQELIMSIANERATKGPHIQMPSVTDSEMVRPSLFWETLDEERFSYR